MSISCQLLYRNSFLLYFFRYFNKAMLFLAVQTDCFYQLWYSESNYFICLLIQQWRYDIFCVTPRTYVTLSVNFASTIPKTTITDSVKLNFEYWLTLGWDFQIISCLPLCEKCLYSEFFLSVFSRIRTEYGGIIQS